VAVPVRTAYDQWTQFEDFPHFMEDVEEVQQVDDQMTHWRVKMAGVTREFDARITEQLPDERVAWSSTAGPRQAGVVTFHRLDADHTRVTAQMELTPEGMAESVGDKAGMIKRRVKGDLDRFRAYIEDRGSATGSWRGEVHRSEP
jgi:uncharacterized membrane protein